MTRREKWTIYGEILIALRAERAEFGQNLRLTIVAQRANVPYDRLIAYLAELAERGVVTKERPPALTPEGEEFLKHFLEWNSVLDRFGLDGS